MAEPKRPATDRTPLGDRRQLTRPAAPAPAPGSDAEDVRKQQGLEKDEG